MPLNISAVERLVIALFLTVIEREMFDSRILILSNYTNGMTSHNISQPAFTIELFCQQIRM